jgi:hypothetical protein
MSGEPSTLRSRFATVEQQPRQYRAVYERRTFALPFVEVAG